METGYYKKKPIDWDTFEVDKFVPHLFISTYSYAGCGANTLGLITGVPPTKIKNTNRQNPNHWKDTFMVKYLKDHGFVVRPLTKCDVSCNTNGFSSDFITDRHVLMTSQLMSKNVASWAVVHNKLWYHNFQICSFTGLSLVNTPILTCYILYKPEWQSANWI